MQHYSRDEWYKYVHRELKEDEVILMEEHLYSCDDCMTTYLSIMEGCSNPTVPEVSQDFTDQVLKQIQCYTSVKKNQINRREMFKYYVVAASITMLLMYSGFFNGLVSGIPRATHGMVSSTKIVEELVPIGWSERWMNTTLATLNAITIKQGSDKNEN